jgi:methanogenic corrinoid protein MtbC1
MLKKAIKEFNEALFDTDRELAMDIVAKAIDSGISAEDAVFKIIIPAVDSMIKAISENKEANLAQHFMTSQIASDATGYALARFTTTPQKIGHVVIGTSKGDLHTLGKRIVIGCLKSMMITVDDLGVNVPAERFVDEAVAQNADVIAVSSMMMHTARGDDGCKKIRAILHERGLEDKIKVVVGGAPFRFDRELYKTIGADAWAEDGVSAAKVITDLIGKVQK